MTVTENGGNVCEIGAKPSNRAAAPGLVMEFVSRGPSPFMTTASPDGSTGARPATNDADRICGAPAVDHFDINNAGAAVAGRIEEHERRLLGNWHLLRCGGAGPRPPRPAPPGCRTGLECSTKFESDNARPTLAGQRPYVGVGIYARGIVNKAGVDAGELHMVEDIERLNSQR